MWVCVYDSEHLGGLSLSGDYLQMLCIPRCVFLCVTFLVIIFRLFFFCQPSTQTNRLSMENIKVTHHQ